MTRCAVASANRASFRAYPMAVNHLGATAVSLSVRQQTRCVSDSVPSMRCQFSLMGVVLRVAIAAVDLASAPSRTLKAVARTLNVAQGSNVYVRRASVLLRLVAAIPRAVRGCVPEIAWANALRRGLIARPMMRSADASVSAERRRRSLTGVAPRDVNVESLNALRTTLFVDGSVTAVRCRHCPRAARRPDVCVTDRIVHQVTPSARGCVRVNSRRFPTVAPCRAARVKDLTVRQMTRSVIASARAANSQNSPMTVDHPGAIVKALSVRPMTRCVVGFVSRVNSRGSQRAARHRAVTVVIT